jgi:cytidine deaminase
MKLGFIEATSARDNLSYAPFSGFKVGAYLETDKLDFRAGNVEHENSQLNLCSERLIIALAKGKKATPKHLHLISDSKEPIFPCGVCRQSLSEFPSLKLTCWSADGSKYVSKTVRQLLPLPYIRKK